MAKDLQIMEEQSESHSENSYEEIGMLHQQLYFRVRILKTSEVYNQKENEKSQNLPHEF